MISFTQDFARLSVDLKDTSLEILLTRGVYQGKRVARKKFLVNGVAKSVKNFVSKFFVIVFEPEDIQLTTGSPSLRRNLLNFVLSQIDWQYYHCLSAYQKGLRQRNKLLSLIQQGKASIYQLEYWDRLIIKNGQIIQKQRQEFIDFINQLSLSASFQNYYPQSVIQNLSRFSYQYHPNIISSLRLEKYRQAEIASGNTLIGPHRDDFQFLITINENQKDLSEFASRGQQRLAILNLKLGQLEFIKTKTDQSPILLLDDIFSELDQINNRLVIDIIGRHTSFITSTSIKIAEQLEDHKIIHLPL